jgi:hypothetical protein
MNEQTELGTYIPMNLNEIEDTLGALEDGTYVLEVVDTRVVLAKKEPNNPMARITSRPIFKVDGPEGEKIPGGLIENFVLAKRQNSHDDLTKAEQHEVGLAFFKRLAKACGVESFDNAGFDIASLKGCRFGARVTKVTSDLGSLNEVKANMRAEEVPGYAAVVA